MSDDKAGVSADTSMLFVFPEGDKWRVIQGSWIFVEGHVHKITIPGLEMRSGETFGITGSFHILENMAPENGKLFGKVARMSVANGVARRIETVAEKVELIGILPPGFTPSQLRT